MKNKLFLTVALMFSSVVFAQVGDSTAIASQSGSSTQSVTRQADHQINGNIMNAHIKSLVDAQVQPIQQQINVVNNAINDLSSSSVYCGLAEVDVFGNLTRSIPCLGQSVGYVHKFGGSTALMPNLAWYPNWYEIAPTCPSGYQPEPLGVNAEIPDLASFGVAYVTRSSCSKISGTATPVGCYDGKGNYITGQNGVTLLGGVSMDKYHGVCK